MLRGAWFCLQVSSYSLICDCGGSLAPKRLGESSSGEISSKRRRTERIQRGKPNYYDAMKSNDQNKKVGLAGMRVTYVIMCRRNNKSS